MTQAKVARVGRREYAREALPPSCWRQQIKGLAYWVGVALLGWLIWPTLIYFALRA